MTKKKSHIIAVFLSLSLLSISCKDEDLATLSTSVIFNIEKNSGKISLPDKVNLVANDVQNNDIIEAQIPIDQKGKGNIGGLTTSNEWHAKFWIFDNFEENLGYITNTGFKLYQQGFFLPQSPVFFAGIADFYYQTSKSIYLVLKPQTRRLTFRLIINSTLTNNLPQEQEVSGIFSGVVSERVFGPKQTEISEENIGRIPLKFTSSDKTPYIFEASYRLLGISEKKKCEIQLNFSSDFPLTIDLTKELKSFNDFSSDEMVCTIYINRTHPQIEIETSVVLWEDDKTNYEYHM